MPNSRETTAKLATQIQKTFEERGEVYGLPEVNFANIAAFWQAWISSRYPENVEFEFDAVDVGMMSACIKLARLAVSPRHEDSALDAAVYIMLAHGCAISAEEARQALERANVG